MQSKTLIALGALVAIGLLAFVTLRSPEKGERTGPRPRPIPALKAADVKELQITSNGGKDAVTLKNDGGKWRVATPTDYPADAQLAKTAVEQLEKVGFADIVAERKEKHADLEVSEDKGAHVVAKDGSGKALFDAWLGKSVSGFTMVRPAGKDEVWQATGLFKYTYAKDAKQWRDHGVFSFNRDDAKQLTVEANGQKIVLEKVPPAAPPEKDKPAPEARWKVVEASVKVDPLDDAVANQMLTALASLSAADFDDAVKPDAAGTDKPRYRVAVATGGASPLVLRIGNAKGEDVWAQAEGKPQIYLMHKYSLERVMQKPIDFRDKTLLKAKEEDLVGIDVAHGAEKFSLERAGTTWKLGKGAKGELDESKAKGVVTGFDDLKASAFADTNDPAATGLAKPAGEVTVRLRDKSSVTLKIGAATKDAQEYYVQRAGSADVMQVKKYSVERIWKKLSELTKAAAK